MSVDKDRFEAIVKNLLDRPPLPRADEKHPSPIDILTRAGRYLMDQKDIWYDRVPNEHGDMVPGPHYQAITLLFVLASDLRKESAGGN